MKKILSIITLFLFLEIFFPSVIFAGCDPAIYDSNQSHSTSEVSFSIVIPSCGTDQCINSSHCTTFFPLTSLYYCTSTCWPKKGTTITKDPTCSPGYTTPTACALGDPLYCCLSSAIPYTCVGFESQWLILCDDLKRQVTYSGLKTYCGGYGPQYKYDEPSGRCIVFNPTVWSRHNISCTDASTGEPTEGFATAIGCVPTGNLQAFLKFVLVYAFVASGGIILLLIISTGYTLITSSGNPEKLQGAQENIVALFSGLALIAFSLVLLQTIGADILNLKAFMPTP